MQNKKIIVIADSHIGSEEKDLIIMIEFIRSLNPFEHQIILLGDIFFVWVEFPKYHTSTEKKLFSELSLFRRNGGSVFLTSGNRDFIFSDYYSNSYGDVLPFDMIKKDNLELNFQNGLIYAQHGDMVNKSDKKYLIWRIMVKSLFVKFILKVIPAILGIKAINYLEKTMKEVNSVKQPFFPKEHWEKFVKDIHEVCNPNILLVGHFHPKEPIVYKYNSTTGIVVPAWCSNLSYLVIDNHFNYSFRTYNPKRII
jgi:UDP-2,3-diacylglucosamine pyrophosphatase LpxH